MKNTHKSVTDFTKLTQKDFDRAAKDAQRMCEAREAVIKAAKKSVRKDFEKCPSKTCDWCYLVSLVFKLIKLEKKGKK